MKEKSYLDGFLIGRKLCRLLNPKEIKQMFPVYTKEDIDIFLKGTFAGVADKAEKYYKRPLN